MVPEGADALPAEKLRILVGDDLRDATDRAVSTAFEFGASSRGSVLELFIDTMNAEVFADYIRSAIRLAHARGETMASAEEIQEMILKNWRDKLSGRCLTGKRKLQSSGGAFEEVIATGKIAEVLEAKITAFKPDLLVFGRHRGIHTEFSQLGQLTLFAMLALHRPILIVP